MGDFVEYRALYESDGATSLFKGLSPIKQAKLAEYGRLISIKVRNEPQRHQFYMNLFIICQILLTMDFGDFELEEISEKYRSSNYFHSDDTIQTDSKPDNGFFEDQVISAFLKYKREHGL